eukprot:1029298-Rhodomonas_salina.1
MHVSDTCDPDLVARDFAQRRCDLVLRRAAPRGEGQHLHVRRKKTEERGKNNALGLGIREQTSKPLSRYGVEWKAVGGWWLLRFQEDLAAADAVSQHLKHLEL